MARPKKLIPAKLERKWNAARKRLMSVEHRIITHSPTSATLVHPRSTPSEPIGPLVDEFMKGLSGKPKTVEVYKNCMQIILAITGRDAFLTKQSVRALAEALHKTEYSQSYKSLIASCARKFLSWLNYSGKMEEELSDKHTRWPAQPIQKPRPCYTESEYRKLLDVIPDGHPLKFVVTVAWACGASVSDCCNMVWGNVDLDKHMLSWRRQKTNASCKCSFDEGDDLHKMLLRLRVETERAFGSIQPGLPVCRSAYGRPKVMTSMMTRYCRKAGITGKSSHSFRATKVSALANAGVHPTVAMQITGHRDFRVFSRYATVSDDAVRVAQARANAARSA